MFRLLYQTYEMIFIFDTQKTPNKWFLKNYSFLVVLGLHHCMWAFSVCKE